MLQPARESALILPELEEVINSDPFATSLMDAVEYTRSTTAEAAFALYKSETRELTYSPVLFGPDRLDQGQIKALEIGSLILAPGSKETVRADLALGGHTHPALFWQGADRSVPSGGDLASVAGIEAQRPGTTFFVASPQDNGEALVMMFRAPTAEISRELQSCYFDLYPKGTGAQRRMADMLNAGLRHAWLTYDDTGRLIKGSETLGRLYGQRFYAN